MTETKHITRKGFAFEEVVKLYKSGLFQREIAEKCGVTQSCISHIIRKMGASLSPEEFNRHKWERMTPEQRARQLDPAHIAARVKKRDKPQKMRHALSVQESCKLSENETRFLNAFAEAGIRVIPQFALDIYNIDFAIPERHIAIEIDGGKWHNSKVKRKCDTGKEVLLRNRGWVLIRFSPNERLCIKVDFTTQNISDIINTVCSNPSLFS